MAKRKQEYGNESISMLEGADRVRKRPGVIFGSDGLEGCEHAVFEILSNAIDEAREGHGKLIIVTRFEDRSHPGGGLRPGLPGGLERKASSATTGSWSSASCTPAANMTTTAATTTNTPWASTAWAPAPPSTPARVLWTPPSAGTAPKYTLHFEKGEIIGELHKEPSRPGQKDGLHLPLEARPGGLHRHRHPRGVLSWTCCKRQAVVNAGITFRFQQPG